MMLFRRALARDLARSTLAIGVTSAFAACSGGGVGLPPPAAVSSPAIAAPAAGVPVTFTMHWPAAGAASTVRRTPAYVPVTARSVSIAVNGGVAQYLNAPATTLVIDAPVGTDTFVFQTYDSQNGVGNVLSLANVTQAIVSGTANVVGATLNGVIASLKVSLGNALPSAGVPATVAVNVAGLDADGNTIVGPGDFDHPILLSTTTPAASEVGAVSLSTNVVATPGTPVTLTYSGGTLTTASIVASATGVTSATTPFAPVPTFYQFSLPVAANRPQWIAAGSDGNLWFTSPGGSVARITPAGVVTAFTIPTANAQPQQIISASDGNLWFTEYSTTPMPGTSKIAKLTTGGAFTEYSTLFAPPPADDPLGIVGRGDGNIWYTADNSSRVGYQGIASGVAGEASVPTANSGPFGIATAPDNNLYYTETFSDKIGRVANLFSAQTEIALTAGTTPESIVRGPDGNLWFAEYGTGKIGRLSPSAFAVTGEFPTVTPNSQPVGLTVGRDGALWFTESGLDRIGRITTGGTVTEFSIPDTGLGLRGITVASDGALWFCEPGTGLNPGRIGKLVY